MLFQKKAADGGDTWLIVGLGNPEKKYDGTRHNVGFETLDHLAECWNIQPVKAKFQGLWGQGTVDGRKVVLLKPLTCPARAWELPPSSSRSRPSGSSFCATMWIRRPGICASGPRARPAATMA